MRVFVLEFVTGGGMAGAPLSLSLAREGEMMRDSLIRDLLDIFGVEVVTTRDPRAAEPACPSVLVRDGDDPWEIWRREADRANVCWAVAPEIGGALLRLTRLMRDAGAEVIGPDGDAIRIGSSKRLTAEALIAVGVAAAPVWRPEDVPADAAGPFVQKPDDGAGCSATTFLEARPAPDAVPDGFVLQAFVPGEAASLTVLKSRAGAKLLAANHQRVTLENGSFAFHGLGVGALDDASGALARLAEAACAALPGLSGIFGIDVVLGPDGPVVIEINPRLTTAYAGLREAIGVNPATLVEPFASGAATPPLAWRAVEVAL